MLILKFNLTECCKSLKTRSEDKVKAIRAKQKGSGKGWNINVGFPLNNFDSCLTQSKIEYLWLMFWPLYL